MFGLDWYWVAAIAAIIAGLLYYFYKPAQKGESMGILNWLLGGGILIILIMWWIDLFQYI